MGHPRRPSPSGRWVVRLGPVSMCLMTCAQLDDAHRRGLVDDMTLVLPDGGRQWITLGERNASRRETARPREVALTARPSPNR